MLKNLFALLLICNSLNAEIVTDGTLGQSGALLGPDYLIGADSGRQSGGNLFHSFQDFNLNSSESATFSGPNSINNIINRVTGGNPSDINGLIRSTIPDADMYFLNPYGIMFGSNAKLDVQGGFHASTANYLRLGENGRFYADLSENSSLSIAPPSAFGFWANPVTPISVKGSQLSVGEGKTFSIIGGDLQINRQAAISAAAGRINMAGVASQGEVVLKNSELDVSSFSQSGDIAVIDKSIIQTSGESGGNIFIRSGQLFVNDSDIDAKTLGSQNGGSVDIQANEVLFSDGAVINGHTFGSGTGVDINIRATESVSFTGENSEGRRTRIFARLGNTGDAKKENINIGDAGTIFIKAKNIYLKGGAGISVSSFTQGKGGDIVLNAQENIIVEGKNSADRRSYIASTSSYEGENGGDGGRILLEAENVSFIGGSYINSGTYGAGKGSDVLITAKNINVNKGSYIIAVAYESGNAGTVTLRADRINLTGVRDDDDGNGSIIYVSTSVNSTGGNAGDIFVEAQDILLADGGGFSSISFGPGNAGNVQVYATGTITIIGASQGGWGATINSSSNPKREGTVGGEGGNITIEAGQLIIKDGGAVAASSIAPEGVQSSKAGNITIRVQGAVELSGVNPYGENEDGFGSGIYTNSIGVENNAGDAGNITLQAGFLIIKDGAVIKGATNNDAQGGNINIHVTDQISVSGDSANIILKEPSDAQLEFQEGFTEHQNHVSVSGIHAHSESASANAGRAGQIHISADRIDLIDGASINASTKNADGGNIMIAMPNLVYLQTGEITTSVHGGKDDGGNITIKNPAFVALNQGQIKAQADEGRGGNINIKSKHFIISPDSLVSASSRLGIDGNIRIDSPAVNMEGLLVVLPSDFVDAGNLITTPCNTRPVDNLSSFVVRKNESIPNSSGSLLPGGPLLLPIENHYPVPRVAPCGATLGY